MRPTKNVTIANCFVTGCYELGSVLDGSFKKFAPGAHAWNTGRIKCGTESNGGFINITIAGCVFESAGGAPASAASIQLPEDESKYPEPGMFGMTPAFGFYLRHVRNVELSHIEVATQSPDGRVDLRAHLRCMG